MSKYDKIRLAVILTAIALIIIAVSSFFLKPAKTFLFSVVWIALIISFVCGIFTGIKGIIGAVKTKSFCLLKRAIVKPLIITSAVIALYFFITLLTHQPIKIGPIGTASFIGLFVLFYIWQFSPKPGS